MCLARKTTKRSQKIPHLSLDAQTIFSFVDKRNFIGKIPWFEIWCRYLGGAHQCQLFLLFPFFKYGYPFFLYSGRIYSFRAVRITYWRNKRPRCYSARPINTLVKLLHIIRFVVLYALAIVQGCRHTKAELNVAGGEGKVLAIVVVGG